MTVAEPTVRSLAPTRVAAKAFWVRRPEDVPDRVGPAFDDVWNALHAAGIEPGTPIAWYAMDAEGIDCWAGFEAELEVEVPAVEVVDLAAAHEAVVVRVLGAPSGIMAGWQAVSEWLEANGAVASAPGREVYLSGERGDEDAWITEVQQPFVRS